MCAEAVGEIRKFVVPEIVYGLGALDHAGRYAANYGARKALVVTDPGVAGAGWTTQVLGALDSAGVAYEVFSDVTPNPKEYEVAAGVKVYDEAECDVIIAVGGGSPMDCAKGIGAANANGMSVLDFEGVDMVPTPGPPLICVPTTAGSSADVSQFAIINDTSRQVKIAIVSKTMIPDAALIDPRTTTTMSAELTAVTGMDALAHAIEAYASNASSPLTDLHAIEAVALVAANLVEAIAHPDDLRYRHKMMLGSLFAGLAFSNASLGLVHAMAHSLGGLRDVPHGLCNAELLEHVVGFNYPAASERYDRVASAMGVDLTGFEAEQRRDALKAAIRSLREAVGIRGSLGGEGVNAADIQQLAENALRDPCLATNPRVASIDEIGGLYEQAL